MKPSSNFPNRIKKKPTSKSSSGEIRIIGGQWRGRRLKVQDKEGLRPTTDRLKETLFNWLMTDVRNAKVLDCFCGAGSLGFEAASRGANSVLGIEKDKRAAEQLKSNCKMLNATDQVTIKQGDCFRVLAELNSSYDLIFIDPPFNKNLVQPCLKLLIDKALLDDNALVYIEQEASASFDLLKSELASHFEVLKEKSAGQVKTQLVRYRKLT